MTCLRCGYCCVKYPVAILKDANKKPSEKNLEFKEGEVRCPKLLGGEVGNLSCASHDKKYYQRTPCFTHCQVEAGNVNCRMGTYVMGLPADQRWKFVFGHEKGLKGGVN